MRPRHVTRHLGRGLAQGLTFVAGDARSRETAEGDPGRGVRARIAAGQPAQEIAVVDEEVVPGELMRIVDKRRDAEGQQGDPEVHQPAGPDGHGGEQQHHQRPSAQVDGRARESRVQHAKGDPGGGEATAGTDVARPAERQILMERMGVDLTDEDLEEGGQGDEVLGPSGGGTPEATFRQLLHHQGHKGDEEDDEDGQTAASHPVQNRTKVGTTGRLERVGDGYVLVVVTHDGLVTERPQVDQTDHEQLYRQDDEHVVDVEARMGVVEGQEPIERQLRAQVIILAREHLLAHAGADLGGEVQDRSEAQITTLTALIVLAMFDTAAA